MSVAGSARPPVPASAGGRERRGGRPSTGARERILAAARRLIASEGYGALTTARIASDSGQNKALIQYHFGSKDGLIAAAAEAIADDILAVLAEAVGSGADPVEFVDGTLERMWEFLLAAPEIQRVYFDTAALAITNEVLRDTANRTRERYRALLERRIAEVTAGRLTGAQAHAAATYLMACFDGLALDLVERGETPDLRAAREIFRKQATALLS